MEVSLEPDADKAILRPPSGDGSEIISGSRGGKVLETNKWATAGSLQPLQLEIGGTRVSHQSSIGGLGDLPDTYIFWS